jgi:anti-sigma regulatory factor (Ser/Thr protein kinase)
MTSTPTIGSRSESDSTGTPHPLHDGWLSRTELLMIFAFWTFMALVTAANRLGDGRGGGLLAGGETTSIALAFVQSYLWALLTPPIFILVSRYGVDRSNRVSRVIMFVLIGVVIAFLVDQLMFFLQRTVVDGPGGPPGRGGGPGGRGFGLGPPDGGGIDVFGGRGGRGGRGPGGPGGPGDRGFFGAFRRPWILNHFVLYFAVLAAGFARDYFLRYRARLEESVRLQAETARLHAQLADARLGALRAQLDPHFLFNTLHAISSLVERAPKGVRRMIARLSELLRYSLEENDEQEIPLRQELAFLDRYLEIMRIRFQGALDVVVDVDSSVQEALVPNLVLQPLVENAVKHGVSKLEGGGRIVVRARRDGDRTVMTVEDNGPGFGDADEPGEEGVGLRNTRERLEQLYGSAQRLTLREIEGGGLMAEVIVPFQTRGDLRTAIVAPPIPGAIP